MQVEAQAIPEVKLIIPARFGDSRGWFSETWSASRMAANGLNHDFVQDNHSLSAQIYTLRGLHYQAPPFAQTKLVRVASGRVLDVAVDVRPKSETFLKWVAVELTAAAGEQLLVPKGFLHGFLTLEPRTEVLYKVDAPYSGEADGAIRFDDPTIGVDWGVDPANIVISEKDAAAPYFTDWSNPFEGWSGDEP
ncbi:dTDP-4-dehydrorhamnose 3,5-epimerase [Pikeienuella piscinae]|uniref:dTDP-4-dehydrorhamnose 3,5-epimerase n=1 Tax=Pikeienuella piscinae TaxID=2748098 RepID=A0A7L5C2B7_9RHOB|nr:dTDP-4-dehydrorhamnose 3,5-epimerase [Pikeienuella piscinae]QIE56324.1 dTDP-4-dehydrorhamnose 3,5-epimerase [Pikeienuella piscinae]